MSREVLQSHFSNLDTKTAVGDKLNAMMDQENNQSLLRRNLIDAGETATIYSDETVFKVAPFQVLGNLVVQGSLVVRDEPPLATAEVVAAGIATLAAGTVSVPLSNARADWIISLTPRAAPLGFLYATSTAGAGITITSTNSSDAIAVNWVALENHK